MVHFPVRYVKLPEGTDGYDSVNPTTLRSHFDARIHQIGLDHKWMVGPHQLCLCTCQ